MLKVNNIVLRYGGILALKGVSLEVNKGEIVALIGANGAGKTSVLKAIMAVEKVSSGEVYLDNVLLTGLSTDRIVSMGLCLVPEGRRIFTRMSVHENLLMGAFLRKDKKGIQDDIEKVLALFPRLKERLNQKAGTLSGGEQQMLAIARGMMSRPKYLFLDEPSLGLAPVLVDEIFKIIKEINESGTSLLIVEQNAVKALKIANRGYVIETGNITISGTSEELLNSEHVRAAYLGGY
ncbi:MAG: ABC transporter ATP-binding protein [Fervidicoccus fontis]|uniref:Amino acid/amide ABC transporter ATP-binding protein 2, HAAT family n=1 Tax=Thermodesulfobium acidiphilum TaxID=1794699 RepID=A0A2R4VYD9_THEAF|nr:ABC transporter ATP-binding protein [Thermodesulfobium acidiphilum]AWB09512.1 amino acid/amide ABC transporter ATP-binding protein 2, HAAT family [Thermodesulfobium acidiphilum]PMB77607.1 MAG: ABC transporter ATP-binding protein [Fervidicoccus fontis]HEM55716.1 ABC transporter ATP-binding protein [Thermodesulfobium narugense]